MKVLAALLAAAALVPVPLAAAAPAAAVTVTVTITAATHSPHLNVKWPYAVHVTGANGKPLRATLTMNVLDPFGGVHAVELGDTHRVVRALPVNGVFRDFMRWPPDSKGFTLKVRATVRVAGVTKVATFAVKPVP